MFNYTSSSDRQTLYIDLYNDEPSHKSIYSTMIIKLLLLKNYYREMMYVLSMGKSRRVLVLLSKQIEHICNHPSIYCHPYLCFMQMYESEKNDNTLYIYIPNIIDKTAVYNYNIAWFHIHVYTPATFLVYLYHTLQYYIM